MARMYPERPRPGTTSEAERLLFSLFREHLDDHFVVFHSVWWQYPGDKHVQDGETDFLIAHPERGFLTLEVKGGAIHYDGAHDQWFSNEHPIKDPVAQARQAKYALINLLRAKGVIGDGWVTFGHAVSFPDVAVPRDLRLDLPREVVLDNASLENLAAWVDGAFRYWQREDQQAGAPGSQVVRRVIELLAPSWDLRPRLGEVLRFEEEQIKELTEQQYQLLDFIGRNHRAIIAGCAGSGKTTLAVEKAIRLERSGFRVLLTCYNRHLAEELAAKLQDFEGIDVLTFHQVCVSLCREAELELAGEWDSEFFDRVLPEVALQAVDMLGPRYDAVVVDEGQDFGENWWLVLEGLLTGQEAGAFYVFYDDNQLLYRPAASLPFSTSPFVLDRNLRNTQRIHDLAVRFYKGSGRPKAMGPPGRPVEFRFYETEEQLHRALRQCFHRLVVEEGVHASDIVVLTPRSRKRSKLWRLSPFGNFELVDRRTFGDRDIFCTTIHGFKGLEAPVVILAEVEEAPASEWPVLFYVGSTRARNHLIVVGQRHAIPEQALSVRGQVEWGEGE